MCGRWAQHGYHQELWQCRVGVAQAGWGLPRITALSHLPHHSNISLVLRSSHRKNTRFGPTHLGRCHTCPQHAPCITPIQDKVCL